jgi:hypothetical protein
MGHQRDGTEVTKAFSCQLSALSLRILHQWFRRSWRLRTEGQVSEAES